MKLEIIEYDPQSKLTFSEWCDRYELNLEANEQPPDKDKFKWHVCFRPQLIIVTGHIVVEHNLVVGKENTIGKALQELKERVIGQQLTRQHYGGNGRPHFSAPQSWKYETGEIDQEDLDR